jgi:hypothetical protein
MLPTISLAVINLSATGNSIVPLLRNNHAGISAGLHQAGDKNRCKSN